MAPYLLSASDHTGLITNTVYDKDPAAGGVVIETDYITINPQTAAGTTTSGTTPGGGSPGTGPTCPTGWGIQGGGPYGPAICVPPVTTSPSTTPAPAPGGSGATVTTGGGTPVVEPTPITYGAPSSDSGGMLILAAAAIALLLVAGGK